MAEPKGKCQYPSKLGGAMRKSEMRDIYRAEAASIYWPEFYVRLPDLAIRWELFSAPENELPLDKGSLLKGFSLAKADLNLNFTSAGTPLYIVNATDEYIPKYEKAAPQIREEFLRYLATQLEEVRIKNYTELIFKSIRKIDALPDRDIRNYIKRVIESLDTDQIAELKENPYRITEIIKKKILKLLEEHAETQFYHQLAADQIFIRAIKTFPQTINPNDDTVTGVKKSLYTAEERGNDFELRVINEVANLDNVV
jgi:type III restriction enzyme